ncbi:MAG: LysR family transcriptional regulator [Firmicutes bacterium]|nr:LysR family transcriptional regulator [Bacillota bacterium]
MDFNLTALEYVVETAKYGSISKAAQNLFISQPHLSNQIKALESQLGVTLFIRSARGIHLTREGKIFVDDAQSILADIKSLQDKLQVNPMYAVRSNLSVTRSHQVMRCITQFINENIHKQAFTLRVKETSPFQVVEDVYNRDAELGVLHFFEAQKDYFFNRIQSYGLIYHNHFQREFLTLMSRNSPLSKEPAIYSNMLRDCLLVMYGDYEILTASYEDIAKNSGIELTKRRIYVYDRASAMEILQNCPDSYMWITGIHNDTLQQYGLEVRRCKNAKIMSLGGSIYSSQEPLSWSTNALFQKMLKIDWTENIT